MKFKAEKMELRKTLDGLTEITLVVQDEKNKLVTELNDKRDLFEKGISVDLNRWRNRRSNEHNALFWEVCTYLADNLNDTLITPTVIYKKIIQEYGISTIYPVEDSILEMVITDWENRGIGWITKQLRKSKLDGNYTNVQFWFGSSVYDSKQFYRLVEGLKQTCRENYVDISIYEETLSNAIKLFEQKELEKNKGVKDEKQLYNLQ